MQQKNLLVFVVLAVVLTFLWFRLAPQPQPAKPGEAAGKKEAEGQKAAKRLEQINLPAAPKVTGGKDLLSLGSKTAEGTGYQLGVELDPLGAGVRSVVLNRFFAADEMGRPTKEPLELLSAEANEHRPSYLLYAYDNPDADRPLDTLGRTRWKHGEVAEETLGDGRKRQKVSLTAESGDIKITKTYSLAEGDYHLGLEVKLERKANSTAKDTRFVYQLTAAHGVVVEGKWYTREFRNALVGRANARGSVDRSLQSIDQISSWEGGAKVPREAEWRLGYACVGTQYFAAGLVVDDDQKDQGFLSYARPTLERELLADGVVRSVVADGSSFVLAQTEPSGRVQEARVYPREDRKERFRDLQPGQRVQVLVVKGSYNDALGACPDIAIDWYDARTHHFRWENDVTVRVVTDAVEVPAGGKVEHKYLLYHGPMKVSQLYGMPGVRRDLVDRYHDALHLNTLTDYHSPNWLSEHIFDNVGLTTLVIWFTNIIHNVLGWIHAVVPSYGLDIILLTVLVRGMMFPMSRKQQQTTMRMQALAPELKKLQEKLKDDRQALAMAQMELYRKHGVNPFGTCWLLLLQMPIFMGLYFALQESIHFRLEPFWPTWIPNLAAPDMLIPWGQKIPWLSRPEDYGGFFYLGPYFNLLPVIAVVLMIVQQKMMSPPPADEQQAMQMKIMRFMMIFFGLFFYKVAAGLCIYFIASSLWGFAERKLLPKTKPVGAAGATTTAVTAGSSTAIRPGPDGGRAERGRRRDRRAPEPAESNGGGLGGWWRARRRRLREWWADLLEQARKK